MRRGVITEHGYKVGQWPGFFLIMEGESEDAVRATLQGLPFLRDGWFDIEIDPLSRFITGIR